MWEGSNHPDETQEMNELGSMRERYYRKEFQSLEELLAEKVHIEETFRVKFIYLSKPKDFGLNAYDHLNKLGSKFMTERRSIWELNAGTIFALEFCGCPFFQMCDPLKFGCEFGRQLKPSVVTIQTEDYTQEEDAAEEEMTSSGKGRKKRKLDVKLPRKIKKVGCTAMIFARKILRFSGITPLSQAKKHRNEAATVLKEIINEWAAAGEPLSELLERTGGEVVYVGYFPYEEAHDQKHGFGVENNAREPIHPSILAFIKTLAAEHIKYSDELYESVRYFVEQNFPEACLEENVDRRKYWPAKSTVKAIVYQTTLRRGLGIRNSDETELSIHGESDLEDVDHHLEPETEVTIQAESETLSFQTVVKTSEDDLMDTRNYVGQVLDLDAAKERLRTAVKNIESLSDIGVMKGAADTLEAMYEARGSYTRNDFGGGGAEGVLQGRESVDYVMAREKKVRIISSMRRQQAGDGTTYSTTPATTSPAKSEEVVFYVDDSGLSAGDIGQEVSITS